MSDSTENINNLDSYGVWVKRPPQDAASTTDTTSDPISSNEVSIEEPVISEDLSFDTLNDNDTTLSDEELSNITNDINLPEENAESAADDFFSEDLPSFEEDGEPSDQSNNEPEPQQEASTEDSDPFESMEETEISADDFLGTSDSSGSPDLEDGEISLDDFLDGGFTDPNPGAETAKDATTDEISLDDFFDDDTTEKEDDVSNDDPLDIDLSFTEDNELPTEEITDNMDDVSDSFEDDMFDSISTGDAPETTVSDSTESVSMADFDTNTEEISLDDFGIDENSDDATAVAAGAAVNASADSEEVDLADFGIDSDAGESPVKQDVQAAKKNKVVDYDLAITEDDASVTAPTVEEVQTPSAPEETFVPDPISEPVSAKVDTSVLDMIMQELSGLKNEINSLRDEFQDLRNKEPAAPTIETVAIPAADKRDENTGFFDNDDGDDTIALSGDELSNIMNTAELTESIENPADSDDIEIPTELPEEYAVPQDETVLDEMSVPEESVALDSENPEIDSIPDEVDFGEEPDSGLSMELNEEKLEEPNLDDMNDRIIDDEVMLPKVDEIACSEEAEESILVESSSTDLMDSVAETEMPTPDVACEPEATVAEPVIETEDSDEVMLPTTEDIVQETDSIQDDILNDFMSEDETVSEGISEDNIDYLKDDELAESDEAIESIEEPVAEVSETTEEPAAVSITETTEDSVPVTEPAKDNSLPEDIKNDVKSVLLYMDQLLENLPEDKIMEFARSEQFSTYKKLFTELGLS